MSPRPLASEPAIESPYLTAREAALYLRFASVEAFYKAIKTANIPTRHRGRSLLFHRAELDRWLAGEPKVRLLSEARSRHTATVDVSRSAGQGISVTGERGSLC